nr:MAG TPA: hypothetical protein [Caudoviricetes sp.]
MIKSVENLTEIKDKSILSLCFLKSLDLGAFPKRHFFRH